MYKLGKTGPYLIIIAAILPILLWWPNASFANTTSILVSLGQITALVGITLLSINYILSSRFKPVEALFFGLNRMYIVHALVGSFSLIFILLHPAFLILGVSQISPEAAMALIIPSPKNIPLLLGTLALTFLIVLVGITLFAKIEYQKWKSLHKWLNLVLFLGGAHAFLMGGTMARNFPLKIYIVSIILLGIAAIIYKSTYKLLGINIYKYTVNSISTSNNVTTIQMTPNSKPLKYLPGQFAFFEFKSDNISTESHPFSITSDPNENTLSISAKSLGDYTQTLQKVKPGSQVTIDGSYGRFSNALFEKNKQIWIAGGIGVTPFISMLKALKDDSDITFIYSVKNTEEAFYANELAQLAQAFKNLKFTLWITSDKGFLTASEISKISKDYLDRDVFVCGPPVMMKTIKKGFKSMGLSMSKYHSEEFSLS